MVMQYKLQLNNKTLQFTTLENDPAVCEPALDNGDVKVTLSQAFSCPNLGPLADA